MPVPANVVAGHNMPPAAAHAGRYKPAVTIAANHRCLVNDQVITLGMLESIGNCLVDLHGQHEHQSLLQSKEQLNILDDFGNLLEQRKEVGERYTGWRQLELELEELQE